MDSEGPPAPLIVIDDFNDGKRDLGVAPARSKKWQITGFFKTRVGYLFINTSRDVAHMASRVYFRDAHSCSRLPVSFLPSCSAARSVNNKRSSSKIRGRTRPPRSNSADTSRGIALLHAQRLREVPKAVVAGAGSVPSVLRYELFAVRGTSN